MTIPDLATLRDRIAAATGPDRELDAEIMFDLFAVGYGEKTDGGPIGHLWPDDNPSWNYGSETLLIERCDNSAS